MRRSTLIGPLVLAATPRAGRPVGQRRRARDAGLLGVQHLLVGVGLSSETTSGNLLRVGLNYHFRGGAGRALNGARQGQRRAS